VLLAAGHDIGFIKDDWEFVTRRLGWGPDTLLRPHGGHPSLVPVLAYKVTLELFGMGHPEVLRLALTLLDLACGALLFTYAKPRIGHWPALFAAAALMLLGQAFWDIVWQFQIGFLGSLATGTGALVALERERPRLACMLIVLAIASSSLGLPFAVGIGIDSLLRRRRLWVPFVPLVGYAIWALLYGEAQVEWAMARTIPRKLWTGLEASTSAITGMPRMFGPALAIGLLGAVVLAFRRGDRARLTGLAAMPVVFWILEALARPGLQPDTARYIYPAALWIGLLAAEALRGYAPRGVALAGISIVLAAGVANNASHLPENADRLRVLSKTTDSALTRARALGPSRMAPNARPDPNEPHTRAYDYFRALRRYGS
jgi:hypothetical protein